MAVQEESAIMRGLSQEETIRYCRIFRAMYEFIHDAEQIEKRITLKKIGYSDL